ncbi:MAG: OmpH family outer membrane protein [Chromatiaceae bacterium]|nr:OmpH family outer membrane protein [Gammaproteobacteria bacterium]MCP5428200.1 OmpH family outer membrane protein [Chromatiaceae bacterium]MCB1860517.1 OmpH family outer membrane protein [Gammaproteobacteria bacterium]MCB1873272.1 OmpH family outer membrane protein [Gammaproteobacteria bacterium]MCB1878978.1 OmpH family outer membrane protein [Gammaproteobacteria bacterium]
MVGFLAVLNVAAAADVKIGVVDVAKLLEESPQAEGLRKRLDSEFQRRSQELLSQQKQLKNLTDKLTRDGAVMSSSEQTRLEQDIRTRRRQLKASSDEFREDLNLRRNEESQKLRLQLTEVIHQLGKDENIDLILDNAVYASGRVNLTEKVLARLRAQAK